MAYDWAAANTAICEALGLDADNVHALELTLRRGDMPLVRVEFLYMDTVAFPEMLERTFTLVPKDAD